MKTRVREASTTEFSRFSELSSDQEDDKGVVIQKGSKQAANASLLAACVVDVEGNSILSEAEALEIAKSARVAMPLIQKIMELSGFKGDAEKHSDTG